jgi:hypothetical protein
MMHKSGFNELLPLTFYLKPLQMLPAQIQRECTLFQFPVSYGALHTVEKFLQE